MTTGMGDLPHETPRLHGTPLFLRAAERMRTEDVPVFEELADLLQLIDTHWRHWPVHDQAAKVADAYLSDPGDPPAGVA